MAMENVELHVPETIMRRARQAASALHRPVEEVLVDMIAATLPDVEDAPAEMHAELARMTWLSDQELWNIGRSMMSEEDQRRLLELGELQQEQSLTSDQRETQEALLQEYGRVMLRKAHAYALLSARAGRPFLADRKSA